MTKVNLKQQVTRREVQTGLLAAFLIFSCLQTAHAQNRVKLSSQRMGPRPPAPGP